MKKVLAVRDAPQPHWVGDGFPVRSLFSYHRDASDYSPFLLLDYAGPTQFEPAATPRGVGQHPHRGFETVTIVYEGEVAHRDSTGRGGVIGQGDVQWMTAGAGILHEEFHSEVFTRRGGPLEMVQLWVNLPAKDKMTKPGYQAILDRDIPRVELPNQAGALRVIAGEFGGRAGPAATHTPMHVWDLSMKQGGVSEFSVPDGWTTVLVVLRGGLRVNGDAVVGPAQLVLLGRPGSAVLLQAEADTVALLLAGEPINEPIVGHGPFVMNTQQEIIQAFTDFNSGRFGEMPAQP